MPTVGLSILEPAKSAPVNLFVLRSIMKKHTKLEVISEIEPLRGITPQEAIEKAESLPAPEDTRVYAKDYIPAMQILVDKGYTVKAAAAILVASGCTFSAGTLDITFRTKK